MPDVQKPTTEESRVSSDQKQKNETVQSPQHIVQKDNVSVSVFSPVAPDAPGETLWASVTEPTNTTVISEVEKNQKDVDATALRVEKAAQGFLADQREEA